MNPNPQRNSNLLLCAIPIALGVLCIFGTLLAAILLKDGIIGRVGKTPNIESLGDTFKISSLNQRIESKERDIEIEKKMSDSRKVFDDARKKLGKNVNSGIANFEQEKTDKIKKLEGERTELIKQKDDLSVKLRARQIKSRTWSELFEDYGIGLFIAGVLPLGLLSLTFMRLLFRANISVGNRLSLTDFEVRSVLFLLVAIVFSAFSFFLFVWILMLIY